MAKLNVTAVILTYNEELHIARCLKNILQIAAKVYVIDSYSTDNTVELATKEGAEVLQHQWPGNQAQQFNWALQNISIQTQWIFRLDADEYLLPELIEEISNKLPTLDAHITGIVFKRRHIFLGKWIKRGEYPKRILRLFQAGKAVCEQRLMDEHIQLLEGQDMEFENDFVDHNLHTLGWWIDKHNNYSIRDAVETLDIELGILGNASSDKQKTIGQGAASKRDQKHRYTQLPLFWRSSFYFIYRYFLKGGFLEGKEAFLWHFFQGWWYRMLIDAKIYEIKKACGNDKQKIIHYLKNKYHIHLP
jgi:glycosyltransferase involved in cell wall biosynthesis